MTTATGYERKRAVAPRANAYMAEGYTPPAAWKLAMADPPSLNARTDVPGKATSKVAALVPPQPPKVTMAEAREAALQLGEGQRVEVVRDGMDVHKAALVVMANRQQPTDIANITDPVERMKFGENYKAALLDISASLGGLR